MSAAPGTGTLHPPADFAIRAAGMTLAEIEQHFGCCDRVASRWRREAGLPQAHGLKRPTTEELQRLTDTMTQEEASGSLGITVPTFRKWQRQAGIAIPKTRTIVERVAVAQGRRERVAEVAALPSINPQAEAARAFLQRKGPIWHCDADGGFNAQGAFFRFYGKTYDADGIVAAALAKGWDPDGWARVAA